MRHSISDSSNLILDRRSISPERFSGRKVHRETIEEVLQHGTWAPNHGLTQPWRFHVFMDGAAALLMDNLSAAYRAHAGDAALESKAEKIRARGERCNAIVALGLAHDAEGRFPLWEDQAALAAAVQNMYLMCTAHGIGGFWSTPGFLGHPLATTALGHEEGVQGMGLFYMGYPDGEWPSKGHRKPLEYVTRWKTE
ncbi:nitroreductase [Flavobacteriales bacterium]|nr:nitroreductase [Flavobacteriales bacterium]